MLFLFKIYAFKAGSGIREERGDLILNGSGILGAPELVVWTIS